MKKGQIGVQLYSFRDYIKSIDDVIKTFRSLKEMGYECIELSPALTLPEEDTIRILADEGLRSCGTGINSIKAVADPAATISHVKKLGCSRAVYAYPHIVPQGEDELERFLKELKAFTNTARDNGIRLNYHNHALEFMHFRKRTLLDIIYEEIPELDAELDLFWIQCGGGNPLNWLEKMKGRMEAVHLKDCGANAESQQLMLPLGAGNMEWEKLIPAAEKAGVKYFVVEHDRDCSDPFKSFRTSIEYLQEKFIK